MKGSEAQHRFLEELGGDAADRAWAEAWEAALRRALDAYAWPGCVGSFATLLGRCAADAGEPGALQARFVEDVFVAAAAMAGHPPAVATLERDFLRPVRPALRTVCSTEDDIEEVTQSVRTRLVVGTGESGPGLAGYRGHGRLRSWIRVALVRAGVRHRQRSERDLPFDAQLLEVLDEDPQLTTAAGLRVEVGRALRAAFEALPARDRAAMKMYYRDGAELRAIAAVYRVDVSTVSRRLARARSVILETTTDALASSLGFGRIEVKHLLGISVDPDVSLRSLLPSLIEE